MKLPELTPLQFLVVSLLFAGEKSTRQLRDALAALGVDTRPSAFHRLLQRMRCSLVVDIRRQPLNQSGRTGWEHYHQVTDCGLALWQAARQFYLDCPQPPPGFQPLATEALSREDYHRELHEALCQLARHHLAGRQVFPPEE